MTVGEPLPLRNGGNLTIDDIAAGDAPNAASGSDAAGHNTDGFDVSANNIIIKDRWERPAHI